MNFDSFSQSSTDSVAASVGSAPHPGFDVSPAAVLEMLYQRVFEQEMRGLSICNPAIGVQAVNFKIWQDQWVGVLVTPWFINLLIVRRQGQGWPALKLTKGNDLTVEFPVGKIKFTPRYEPELGTYLCCSLASPMGDFSSHAQAVGSAEDVMRQLTAIPLKAVDSDMPTPTPELSRREFLRGSRHSADRLATSNSTAESASP